MSVMSRLPFESFCPFLHLLNSQHECPIYQNYPKLSKTAVCSVARTHSSHRRKEHIPPLDWCGGDLEQLELSPETRGNMRKDRAGDMLGIRSQTGKKMQKCILTFQNQWMSTANAALLWVLQGILWGSTSLAHSHRIIPSHEKLAPFLHVPFFGLLMRTQIWFRAFAMLLGKNMDWTNFWLCISQSTVQAFGTTKLPWHDLGMQARFRRKKWHLFQNACQWLFISLGTCRSLPCRAWPGALQFRAQAMQHPNTSGPILDGLPSFSAHTGRFRTRRAAKVSSRKPCSYIGLRARARFCP